MAIFGAKDKQGNTTINLVMVDGIPKISNGSAVSLILTEEQLQVTTRIGSPIRISLDYCRIVDVSFAGKKQADVKLKRDRLTISYFPKDGGIKKNLTFDTCGATLKISDFIDEFKQILNTYPTAVEIDKKPIFTPMLESADDLERTYYYTDIFVAYSDRYDTTNVLCNDYVSIIPEPDNMYDDKALALFHNRIKIGYLPKNQLQNMFYDFNDKGGIVLAKISEKNIEKNILRVALGFYSKPKNLIRVTGTTSKGVSFKLTGNTNEEMQNNIYLSSIGDSVDIDYDYEKDKFVVSCLSIIGYIPASKNNYIESLKEYTAFIENIIENENSKYSIIITIISD